MWLWDKFPLGEGEDNVEVEGTDFFRIFFYSTGQKVRWISYNSWSLSFFIQRYSYRNEMCFCLGLFSASQNKNENKWHKYTRFHCHIYAKNLTLMLVTKVQNPKSRQHKGNRKHPRKSKSIAKTKNEPWSHMEHFRNKGGTWATGEWSQDWHGERDKPTESEGTTQASVHTAGKQTKRGSRE